MLCSGRTLTPALSRTRERGQSGVALPFRLPLPRAGAELRSLPLPRAGAELRSLPLPLAGEGWGEGRGKEPPC